MVFTEAGYKALFLSVDVPVLGKRLNEYRNEFRIPADMSYPNILSSGADTSDKTNYGIDSWIYLDGTIIDLHRPES